MRYSPRSSVTALRTFSIRTGLAASTVTPGSTAPDVTVTTPTMVAELVPWLHAEDESSDRKARTRIPTLRYMAAPFAVTAMPKLPGREGRRRVARPLSQFRKGVEWKISKIEEGPGSVRAGAILLAAPN